VKNFILAFGLLAFAQTAQAGPCADYHRSFQQEAPEHVVDAHYEKCKQALYSGSREAMQEYHNGKPKRGGNPTVREMVERLKRLEPLGDMARRLPNPRSPRVEEPSDPTNQARENRDRAELRRYNEQLLNYCDRYPNAAYCRYLR
jgi:hypothetical protein